MPKVSICVPTYNNVEEVKHLLFSISQQSFKDYEIVITDDSTNMEIEDLVKHSQDNKIRYFHNETRLGHIYNWNAAIEKAAGEYIKIMFSDDWFTYPDSLLKYVNMLEENSEADFAFSNSMQVSSNDSYARVISKSFLPGLKEDWRHIYLGNEIGAPSGTIYRNKGIMFDVRTNWASDLELYLMLLESNPIFVSTKEPLISIGLHQEQYTHMFSERDERIFQDYQYMYKKHHLWENENCRRYFLKEYVIKFSKGKKTAISCCISAQEYRSAKWEDIWYNKILCYTKAAGRKLFGWRKKTEQRK